MLPFLSSEFPFLFREATDATRVGSAAHVSHDDLAANPFNMIRVESLNRLPPRSSSSATAACLEIERLPKMWRSNFLPYGRDQVDDSILVNCCSEWRR